MARILVVGVATVDVINTTESYPAEDREIRAVSHRVSRGGNAANTAEVLARLGHESRWAGVLVDEPDGNRIVESFRQCRVDSSGARVEHVGKVPTSYITVSRETGTRTIVHYRNVPEFSARDFARVALDTLDWIHFEGRTPEETFEMMLCARRRAPGVSISVEIEKARPGIERLIGPADVTLFSRAYATARGFSDGGEFLRATAPPGRTAFCAWGSQGAFVYTAPAQIVSRPAVAPPRVVDSVGAGDVFNAGVIDALIGGDTPVEALERAVALAGRKCGFEGFDGL